MTGDMPMPPERFRTLMQARELAATPDPLVNVERRDPSQESSSLAGELLAEAAERPLESGELLLVCEEASLADLEAATAGTPGAPAMPDLVDADPMLAMVTVPRLYAARIEQIFGWQPPLAELTRLLEAALQVGQAVPQTMLVGHVETFPERVEHLMRLRYLVASGRGRVTLSVALADLDSLPTRDSRVARVAAAARPRDAEVEVRHALALAALALGPQAVYRG